MDNNFKPKSNKPTILVVDDTMFMRLVIGNFLKKEGYSILEASNGREAVRVYKNETPDAVLMDITMPEMDGISATKRIKELDQDAIIIIVSAMGQREYVVSALKKGASDFIIKPIDVKRLLKSINERVSPTKKTENKKTHQLILDGLKVLVVDDSSMSLETTKCILEKKNCKVSTASNGKEALKLLKKEFFQLILMDIEMPKMNGYETTIKIRENEEENLIIIALTAYDDKEIKEKVLELGMDGYISKPVGAVQLYNTIEKVVAEKGLRLNKEESIDEKKELPINLEKVYGSLDEDKDLLTRIIKMFFEDYSQVREKLEKAIKEKDASAIARLTHILIGELSTLRAKEALLKASKLNKMAENNNLEQAEEVMMELIGEIKEIKQFISQKARQNKLD